MKTERLYYSDCYLREFDARIVGTSQAAAGVLVYLDRTAFYPASGGQPSDRGELGGIPVLDVTDEGEAIAHLLETKPADEHVKGVIEWQRRFDHMQQHTGQHILSAAFEKVGGYKTVSFHLGHETSTIDLDSDRVSQKQAQAAAEKANEIVFEDRVVRLLFKSEAEAAAMDLRKSSERKGEVRLVEIPEFDLSACGGTHVSRTGAVGLILLRKMDRTKGNTRVEFVCGGRALKMAHGDYALLTEAAREFSSPLNQVPTLIKRRVEELRESLRIRERQAGQLADLQARELLDGAAVKNGMRLVRKVFDDGQASQAKLFLHELAKRPSVIGLAAIKGQPAGLCFVQSRAGSADMAAILKRVCERFGGKGGGTRDFAQGGGLEEGKIEEALSFAESLLS